MIFNVFLVPNRSKTKLCFLYDVSWIPWSESCGIISRGTSLRLKIPFPNGTCSTPIESSTILYEWSTFTKGFIIIPYSTRCFSDPPAHCHPFTFLYHISLNPVTSSMFHCVFWDKAATCPSCPSSMALLGRKVKLPSWSYRPLGQWASESNASENVGPPKTESFIKFFQREFKAGELLVFSFHSYRLWTMPPCFPSKQHILQ